MSSCRTFNTVAHENKDNQIDSDSQANAIQWTEDTAIRCRICEIRQWVYL